MIDTLLDPWPWWLSGLLVGLTVPLLYVLAGKAFGISTSLELANYRNRSERWRLSFVGGIAAGSFLAVTLLSSSPVEFLPSAFGSIGGAIRLLVGGTLIGFGARYAGGCTSGHSITGISNLNPASLVATACFFAGGLAVTWGLGRFLVPTP